MDARSPSAARAAAGWLTLATVAVIVYGSLFPFAFGGTSGSLLDAAAALRFQPTSRGDIVSNVLLYMPLGFCLVLAGAARVPAGVALGAAMVLGTLLSIGIEILQASAATRVSSLTDVAINAFGTFTGGLAAIVYLQLGTRLGLPGGVTARPSAAPLGVVLLWLAFRLAPFVPTIDWQKYKDAIKPLVLMPQIGTVDILRYLVGWLVVGYALRFLFRRAHATTVFLALAAAVLAGRIVVVGKTLSLAEIVALALCAVVGPIVGRLGERRAAALLAPGVVAVMVLQGLAPFTFTSEAQPFGWIPFQSALVGNVEVSYSALLEKAFWFLTSAWLLTRAGVSLAGAALVTATLAAALEAAQMRLPGRSPEITDPLLAIVMVVLLAVVGRGDRD